MKVPVSNLLGHSLAMSLLALLVFLAACAPTGTQEDMSALSAVRARFGHEFSITLQAPVYMVVRELRPLGEHSATEVRGLFDEFFLHDGEPRGSTEIVYLNFYDYAGNFKYQLYYDPQKGAVTSQNKVDYY